MKKVLNFLYWFLIAVAVIQFIPVDRTNPPVSRSENFIHLMHTPHEVSSVLKTACYDCHSNETVYPDYAYVAPVSWSLRHHVSEGREHLNFSVWGTYSKDLKKGMLENAAADIKQQRMPLAGYVAQHPQARLDAASQKLLVDYFESLLKSGRY